MNVPNDYCKQILLDNKCKVDSDLNCVPKNSDNFDQKSGICDFDDWEEKNSCKIKTRKCTEYTIESCGDLPNCIYYPSYQHCIETDEYCTIIDNECSKKNNIELNFDKKCALINDQCVQTEKECNEISIDKCNIVEKKENKQCFNFENTDDCKAIFIDEYCYVNTNGECTNSTILPQLQTCAFNSDKTQCLIKDLECEDFTDNNCGYFIPEAKLCFYTNGKCSEVQVDESCKINEENECVSKNSRHTCAFDDDKEKCYLKNNNNNNNNSSIGYLGNLKYFILLSLLFIL